MKRKKTIKIKKGGMLQIRAAGDSRYWEVGFVSNVRISYTYRSPDGGVWFAAQVSIAENRYCMN